MGAASSRERQRRSQPVLQGVFDPVMPEETVAWKALPATRRADAASVDACRDQSLFAGAAPGVVRGVASHLRARKHKAGKVILAQGREASAASELHILTAGEVVLTATGAAPLHVTLTPPALFGHPAVLFGSARTATAVSRGARTLSLTRASLAPYLPHLPRARLLLFMRAQVMLKSLSDADLEVLAGHVAERSFRPGAHLTTEGQPGHEMFLVRKGEVDVVVGGGVVDTVRRGGFVGQRALHGRPRTATCVARGAVEAVAIADSTVSAIRDPLLDRILACDALIAVQQHARVLGSFSELEAEDMLRSLQEVPLGAGRLAVRRGEPTYAVFVVRRGRVTGEAVAEAGGFQYFGSLGGQPCSSDVVADTDSVLVKASRAQWLPAAEGRLPCRPIGLAGLVVERELGTGQSGRVCLARLAATPGEQVAVKMVAKSSRPFRTGHALREAAIMASLSHPFCVRLLAVTDDPQHYYLLMEYVPGGELFAQLAQQGRLGEPAARFYAACVVLALEYLHGNGIVYRDLKPENLLLDGRGYVKVADFGYANRIGGGRALTMCGTPEYQAPEIMMLDRGATTAADYWSLGVLLYEMLTGASPFLPKTDADTFAILRNSRNGRYEPPRGYEGGPAHDLIAQLLQVEPDARLADPAALKAHPWFRGFDWQALLDRRLPAPGGRWSR